MLKTFGKEKEKRVASGLRRQAEDEIYDQQWSWNGGTHEKGCSSPRIRAHNDE